MACPGCTNNDGGLNATQVQNLINASIVGATDGDFGGFASKWVFSDTVGGTPSATELRYNNAAEGSVTNLHISQTNADSADLTDFLNSFSNGSAFGRVRLFKEYDSSTYWMGTVSSVTDSGSYFTIGVTYVDHSGSFAASDSVVVQFVGDGADGANGSSGSDGVDGVAVVYSDISDTVVNDTSSTLQKQYDWDDDVILDTDGDELRVEIGYEITSAGSKALSVYFGDWSGGGVSILDIQYGDALLATPNKQGKIVIKIKRIDATTAKIWIDLQQFLTTNALTDNFNSVDDHQSGYFTRSITFANFSQIDLVSRVSGGTPLTINELTVYKYEA